MLRARYRKIVVFFVRILTSLLLWDYLLPRLGLRALSERTRPGRLSKISRAFRNLAVQMGGVLIKVGQFLSARVDVLPEEITSELAGLQDEVPPENVSDIIRLAEAELGAPLSELFAAFDEIPLAAASLGQVHRAKLRASPNGGPEEDFIQATGTRDVVLKVQRPKIERIIATDLAALRTVSGWLNRFPPIRRRADIPGLLKEFARVLYEEIDYVAEGQNVETFAAHFRSRPGVRVPAVFWAYTTRCVLTLEDVYAIKITDYEQLAAAGIERADVAKRLFDTYMQQIFIDGFVHADPHPGNLFVQPGEEVLEDGVRWRLTFVDFGMTAQVSPELRSGLRELAIALATQDAKRLIQAYQMMGVLLPTADLELLERAESEVFKRVWGRSMAELRDISMQEIRAYSQEFRELLYDLPFQVPQNMIFLGRTVAILSGMCTGLDPNFNFWENIIPYARRFVAEEAVAGWDRWLEELFRFAETLFRFPGRVDTMLSRMERGDLAVRVPEIQRQIRGLESALRRLIGALIFAALLISGVQVMLAGQNLLGGLFLAGAFLALAWIVLTRGG